MSRLTRTMRRVVASQAKSFVYAPQIRNIVRNVVTADIAAPIRHVAENNGFDGHLRRLTAETLPSGKYFAKLTLTHSKQIEGQRFRLFHDDKIVYSNVVGPATGNAPVDYRNFVVDSRNPSDFELDIDVPYTLQIGSGSFSTPQQVAYDKDHAIEQYDNIFYCLRGNTTNPKRLLLTFPNFSESNSRVSYLVEYLDEISDAELTDTLLVCFQDCYLEAGTYMTIDNGGRSLGDRVISVVDNFISRFLIADDQIMLFGVSKGGSIAIRYSEHLPQSHLVVVAPQLNIPYSLKNSFRRDYFLQASELASMVQPDQYIRTAFHEGRLVDYFYSDVDELSNYSLIELVGDVPGLSKYRIDGNHDDVAPSSLPTVLNIIRRFLNVGADYTTEIVEMNTFPSTDTLGIQLRIDDSNGPTSATNWYMEGRLGRSQFRQILSNHTLPFVKFTSEPQRLRPELDDLTGLFGLVAYAANGDRWHALLPRGDELLLDYAPRKELPSTRLQLTTNGPTPYVIVTGDEVAYFRYECRAALQDADRIDVHLVHDIEAFDLNNARHHTKARYVASVTRVEDAELLDLLIQRLKTCSSCSEIELFGDESRSGTMFHQDQLEGHSDTSVFRTN